MNKHVRVHVSNIAQMFLYVNGILAQWVGFKPVVREGIAGIDKDYPGAGMRLYYEKFQY